MIASTRSTRQPRRFAWMLWLALLIPMAQLAAALHVQSHWTQEGAGSSLDHKAAVGDACGKCVAVASVAAGGATASAPSLPVSLLPFAFVLWATSPIAPAASFAAYRSRAPPASL